MTSATWRAAAARHPLKRSIETSISSSASSSTAAFSLFEEISADEEAQLVALADNARGLLSQTARDQLSLEAKSKRHRIDDTPETMTSSIILLTKVISGGQSGADRAALEAARSASIETGGWIPEGFLTSEGRQPELGVRFGLRELRLDRSSQSSVAAAYVERSKRNVDDSDATIAFRLSASRGTDRTIGYAQTRRWQDGLLVGSGRPCGEASLLRSYRPCFIVAALEPRDQVIAAIIDFIRRHRVRVLNVAGHRASTAPVPSFSSSVESLLRDAFHHFRE